MTDPILDEILQDAKTSVRPQDDLFRWVNGTWLDTHEIPGDRGIDGTFYELHEKSEADVKAIIDELEEGSPEGEAKKIIDLFDSFMDTEAIEAAGTAPLEADLEPIRLAPTKEALANACGTLSRLGVNVPFDWEVDADRNDPDTYTFYLAQSGLGLPDEAYYRLEQHAEVREAYRAFMPKLMELAGVADPAETAKRVYALEKAIASHHADVVTTRDTDKTNNPMSWEDFTSSAPGFDWDAARDAIGLSAEKASEVSVMTPEALTGTAKVWAEAELADLKDYLTWQVIIARAPYLTKEIFDAHFDFFSRTLSGATVERDRWKRAITFVTSAMGEALGKLYVERHFPPEYKEQMSQLVDDLLAAYRESITNLTWMGEETKQRALKKLATFNPKIGYPDKWKDYSTLTVSHSLVDNVRAVNNFHADEGIAKLGKPMDRDEWHMVPQMVNAYYNPVWNEIVFPAAILQPPFFDPNADDAWNYGGIGAVIGHEIGHGFDDQGSRYDELGRINNWWTDADRAAFEERTQALIGQYDAFTPAQLGGDSEHHVNGAFTIGENIGDLGGVTIALKAYDIALKRQGRTGLEDAPVIDGVTGAQRLFYSYARIWRAKARDEHVVTLLAIDPHSPAEFRCNGVVRNIDAFAEAFDVSEGDELYLAPDKRVRIW